MRKPDKNDRNNNSDSTSSFNNPKRSSKFDDITGTTNRPNNPGGGSDLTAKEKAKKIWKWVSIAIYLFFLGLGITGFIQSCVLKTSSTVGAGVELYNSKNEVAPYVNTYKIVEKEREEIQYDSNGAPLLDENNNIKKIKVKYYVIEKKSKDNYLADKKTIKEIKSQLESDYGKEASDYYGSYNNYSSALRIIGLEGVTIENSDPSNLKGDQKQDDLIKGDSDNHYIFMNNKILNYLNANSIAYKKQANWTDINLFVLKRPEGSKWNSLSNSQKDYYGLGITDISNAFTTFENINGKDYKIETVNGKYYTKDANRDGIIDSATYVEITNQERINKFTYGLDAEIATLGSDDNKTSGMLNSEAFARDYIQILLNMIIKFPQMKSFYKVATGQDMSDSDSSSTLFNNLSKQKFEKLLEDNKRFTLEEKNAILTYQNEMTSLMEQIGFTIKRQVYSDQSSDYYEQDITKDFEITFLPDSKDIKDIVVGTSGTAQKPITSWGDSWRLGPFYGIIVYPLSAIINSMMGSMHEMNGWNGIIAIVVAILLTRVIVTLFTYKSLFATHKQQQLNPKKAKIDAKYEPFKGNREMEQRKRQEIAKLYKANNVSMMAPLKAMCLTLPIFFAVWRVVQGIPDVKSTTWLGIQFSLTSWRELFSGSLQYLPLLIFAALTQAVSQYLPRYLNKKRMNERATKAEQAALKKSNKMQNIMMIVFIVLSVIFEAGVQIYWIVSGLWQIMQVLVVHHIVKSNWYRTKGYKYV